MFIFLVSCCVGAGQSHLHLWSYRHKRRCDSRSFASRESRFAHSGSTSKLRQATCRESGALAAGAKFDRDAAKWWAAVVGGITDLQSWDYYPSTTSANFCIPRFKSFARNVPRSEKWFKNRDHVFLRLDDPPAGIVLNWDVWISNSAFSTTSGLPHVLLYHLVNLFNL